MDLKEEASNLPAAVVEAIIRVLDKPDLLNCRSVCRSWNKECLKKLKQLNVTQQVCELDIQNYLDFLLNCHRPRLIFPLHIYVNPHFDGEPIHFETNPNHPLNQVANAVLSFDQHFGPSATVYKLTINLSGMSTEPELRAVVDFLKIVRHGLKYLDIHGTYNVLGDWPDEFKNVPEMHTIRFPELETLKVDSFQVNRLDERYHCRLVPNPMTMESLRLAENFFDSADTAFADLGNLKELNLDHNSYYLLHLLTQIQSLSERSSPEIVKLGVFLPESNIGNHGQLNLAQADAATQEIVENFRETLESLTISVKRGRNRVIPLFSLPPMPKLQSFKIHRDGGSLPQFMDPETCNFNSENLPALVRVDLPVGYFLDSKHKLQMKSPPDPVQFPNVRELTITMHHVSTSRNDIKPWQNHHIAYFDKKDRTGVMLRENLEHLWAVFPNLTKLTVVSSCDQLSSITSHHTEEILIKEIIKSPSAPLIQEFVVRNFDLSSQSVNFLGNALKELVSEQRGDDQIDKQRIPILNMTNVKIVRLEQSFNEWDKVRSWRTSLEDPGYCPEMSFDFDQMDLEAMLNHFPQLRILYISRVMFGSCGQLARSQYIDQLAEQFPLISIFLI